MIDSTRRDLANGQRRHRASRGVSLIEILIVLVILVVGILTIIRLFPSGFFSVESVGNAALADSLGIAAIQAQVQNGAGLPDAILPGKIDPNGQPTSQVSDGAYDPDKADNLDGTGTPSFSAHVISNETVTVPAAKTVNGQLESIYTVNYGPIQMGNVDPTADVTGLSQYVAIKSTPWSQASGDANGPTNPIPVYPQDSLTSGQPSYLVDLTNKQIAVPYAPYTQTSPTEAVSYAQRMALVITGSDGKLYHVYLNLPPATTRDTSNPNAPKFSTFTPGQFTPGQGVAVYIPDTASNYQGGWIDPTTTPYLDTTNSAVLPANVTWKSVTLYRTFQAKTKAEVFDNDPYEFKILNSNIVGTTNQANLGAIAFNPLGAGGVGVKPLQAQITYQTYGWKILHEDRDIPALPAGNTTVTRLTLKNLLKVGNADPDNNIDTGLIPGSQVGFMIEDLDTGQLLSAANNPAAQINDEDLNGPIPTEINLSYATGRITFPSGVFGDANTPVAHHARIYYAGDADWTLAVQKAAASYVDVTSTANASGIAPGQFASASAGSPTLYFAQCEAGKTVAFEGSYNGGGTTFALTGVIGNALYPFPDGRSYVRVDLTDKSAATPALPSGNNIPPPVVTLSAVRGLSARAMVAWKERDQWKVHTVDTVLTKTQ